VAGIVVPPFMDSAQPAPAGGRDRLAVRLAKQLAAREWPGVVLSSDELAAITAAVTAGIGSRYGLECAVKGQPPGSWIRPLSADSREVLAKLLERAPAEPPSPPALPEMRELEDVVADAGMVLDPRTGSWVRRR
jgi:hypothetical protein